MQKEKLKDLKETKERKKVEMKKMLKNKSGITLIALVVTIVILLILAGVSIKLVLDNNGIINKSKEAKNKYELAEDDEQSHIDRLSNLLDRKTNKDGEASKTPKVAVNEKATSNGTINGGEGNLNNPTIPEGYTPINTTTSNWGDGKSAPTQDSVDHGLVIKDYNNNEWVWVPVDSATLATMYETSSDAKTLCGTTVTTNKYSKSEIISGQTRTTPGTSSSYREPDIVVGSSGTSYDAKEAYYKDILGFESKEEMAEAFVVDYNEMIASIEKYGGFYIGRYELSSAGVQKDKATLTNTNWYNLYKKCKELNASNKVEARMIWGCQWDVTMNWLISSGAKTRAEVNNDSGSWGNYKNTSVKADDGITEIKASGTSAKLNTGKTTFTMANNIYDLAGNCFELTQEASNIEYRAYRGGFYDNTNGSVSPASVRYSSMLSHPTSGGDKMRFSSYFNNKVILESRA